jgi:DNA-binding MarR family transcriptional regulator
MGRPPRAPSNPQLHVLMEAVASMVRDEGTDFSARQLAVFLKSHLEPGVDHTVRGLAAELKISKPAITRAVDKLEELSLARREKDPADARSVIIRGTSAGQAYLRKLTGFLNDAHKKAAKATR